MLMAYQAEWGYVYTGRVIISAVNENGQYEVAELDVGDIWYFPEVCSRGTVVYKWVCGLSNR